MQKNEQVYYNTSNVVIESGAIIPAGTIIKKPITFPSDYDLVEKIALIPIDIDADKAFKIAFRKNSQDVVNMTHNGLYTLPNEVAPKDRFLPIIEVVKRDNTLEIAFEPTVDIPANTPLIFDFVMVMTTEEKYSNRLLDI